MATFTPTMWGLVEIDFREAIADLRPVTQAELLLVTTALRYIHAGIALPEHRLQEWIPCSLDEKLAAIEISVLHPEQLLPDTCARETCIQLRAVYRKVIETELPQLENRFSIIQQRDFLPSVQQE